MEVRVSIRLALEGVELDEPIDARLLPLLQAMQAHGSLRQAARVVGVSYRHAWTLLGRWETALGCRLVTLRRGRGHGAQLTAVGRGLLALRDRVGARLAAPIREAEAEAGASLEQLFGAGDPERLRIAASHDLGLEYLCTRLAGAGVALEHSVRGSLDSLRDLAAGRCEVAGFHLPDGAVGRDIARLYRIWLRAGEHALVHVLAREQGLMTARHDPLGLAGLADLERRGVRFVNRQRGSGTRLLLEALLEEAGLEGTRISGFALEEYTHLAVAAMVASGAVDAGFGIHAAAARFGLRFVPLATERYLLAVDRRLLEGRQGRALLAGLRDAAFRRHVEGFAGCRASRAGELTSIEEVLAGGGCAPRSRPAAPGDA